MKDFTKIGQEIDKALGIHSSQAVAPVRRQKQRIGKVHIRPGHRLFKYNTKTGDLSEQQVEKKGYLTQVGGKTQGGVTGEITNEEGCVYFSALNLQNAKKKVVQFSKSGMLW